MTKPVLTSEVESGEIVTQHGPVEISVTSFSTEQIQKIVRDSEGCSISNSVEED